MLKTNREKLVKISLQGKIHHPQHGTYRISHEGEPLILPATGGITYNVKVGDPAFGWVGDHIEPGVTIKNPDAAENDALMTFSCIGNEAVVVSGEAKGEQGYVTGTHGGVNHILVHFEKDILDKLTLDDKILIKGFGQGLSVGGLEDVKIMSIDPVLFERLGIVKKRGKLEVPVAARVPAHLMGSGIGNPNAYQGDYDIMTADHKAVSALGLEKLRFGDLVLLEDCDNSFGRGYLKGAVSVGVIIHSDCVKMGHGPGVTVIMTCKSDKIVGKTDKNANISQFMYP